MFTLLNVFDLPIVDILGAGAIGLGFLLAVLAWRMILKEQQREIPRKQAINMIYVFMLFSVVLCAIGVLQPVLDYYYTPARKPDTVVDEYCQNLLTDVKDELATCVATKQENILPNTLTLISSETFPAGITKDSALVRIRKLLGDEKVIEDNRRHFAYTLFEIEKHMQGKNINLRLENTADKETLKAIQRALKGLERYSGPVNGDRPATYEAVVRFQQWLNMANGESESPYIKPSNYGIFGFRTLEALRTQYRLRGAEG